MTSRERKKPAERRDEIVSVALNLVALNGLQAVSAAMVAHASGCSVSLVKHYFNTMPQLRRAVMRAAIHQQRVDVLAQGLAVRDRHATRAPAELREAAGQWLAGGSV